MANTLNLYVVIQMDSFIIQAALPVLKHFTALATALVSP